MQKSHTLKVKNANIKNPPRDLHQISHILSFRHTPLLADFAFNEVDRDGFGRTGGGAVLDIAAGFVSCKNKKLNYCRFKAAFTLDVFHTLTRKKSACANEHCNIKLKRRFKN